MPETESPKTGIDEGKLSEAIAAGLSKALPEAFKPIMSEMTAGGGVRRAAAEPVHTEETINEVSEETILEAVEAGDKAKAASLMRQNRRAAEQRVNRELNQIRAAGANAIGSVAALAADKLPHYKRFKKEIDAKISEYRQNNPGVVVTPEMYEAAHKLVVGEHYDELLAEAREEAIRQRDEAADLSPTGRVNHEPVEKEPESLSDLLAGNWKREFGEKTRQGRMRGRTDEEELRIMGFNGGFKGYLGARKSMEALEEATQGTFGLDADWACKEHDRVSCERCRKAGAEGSYVNA